MSIIETGHRLSSSIAKLVSDISIGVLNEPTEKMLLAINKAEVDNRWFTKQMSIYAFTGIAKMLERDNLRLLPEVHQKSKPMQIGIICAGNIPMVGFHDLWCVLYSGHNAVLKLSTDDTVLMTYLSNLLIEIDSSLKERIIIVDRLKNADAIIATGSNNSFRYFDYYFGKQPHIFRKNRNSVALLTGNETEQQLKHLASDLLMYFGLGCRNISKLMVPKGYNFDFFFECIQTYGDALLQHNKYCNNYDYHKALYLLELIPFLTNNFLIVRESDAWSTPVSVLHYERYENKNALLAYLESNAELLQCIAVANIDEWPQSTLRMHVLGTLQQPVITDYADGINTLTFLSNL
jgi:hypothetical protein